MDIIFGVICGVILGVFLGAAFILLRKTKAKTDISQLEVRAQAADSVIAELRNQLAEENKTVASLRDSLRASEQAKTIAETKLIEANKNLEEQKNLLDKAHEKLTTTFQALSGESLKSNSEAFINLARQTLEVVLKDAKGEFGKKEEAIKNLISPLEEALKRYDAQIKDMESKRASAYGSLETQLKQLMDSQQLLQKETGNLVTALRRPEIRGRWGEITLRRIVELAGMTEHCDFTEQVSVATEESRIRPDMVIHLPANREIVVDSKVAIDACIDAISADTVEKRKDLLTRHAQSVRRHMKVLSAKTYWDQFSMSPEFVVLFIPGESFLSMALEVDHTLIEDGMECRVFIATPTILISLLRAVAYGWRQEQIAKNAQLVADLGKQVYERFSTFLGHVEKTRDSLEQSIYNFNRMINSLDGRIMPSLRKFRELGATGADELPTIETIEQTPKQLDVPEANSKQLEN